MRVKTKILTVTRDTAMVSLLQKELNHGNYEIVNTECSGVYLRDVIRAETPDFIILDIIMPSLDGIGTCLQIRQWTQTPIMMLSTWAQPASVAVPLLQSGEPTITSLWPSSSKSPA